MTINMIIITVILSLASGTRQYACDEDAARALKRREADAATLEAVARHRERRCVFHGGASH